MTNAKGKPILKRWRFVCSSPRLATTLGALRCQHAASFKHGELTGGADTAKSAYYTDSLCRSILAGYFGSYTNTPAMACTHAGAKPRGQGHHRESFLCEGEDDFVPFGFSAFDKPYCIDSTDVSHEDTVGSSKSSYASISAPTGTWRDNACIEGFGFETDVFETA